MYNSKYGTVKTEHCALNITGQFVNDGTYISDPADNHFADVMINTRGAFVGGKGDRFFVTGNFRSQSTDNTTWNTRQAQLLFVGDRVHIFDVNGTDLGATAAGYENNFAWDTVTLEKGGRLVLENASQGPDAALYLQWFDLEGGIKQIAHIQGNGVDIYYDPTLPEDAYLKDKKYSLRGGGYLLPDPEDPDALPDPKVTVGPRPDITPIGPHLSPVGSAPIEMGVYAAPLPAQAIPAAALLVGVGAFVMWPRRRRA